MQIQTATVDTGQNVPHLDEVNGIEDLKAHYLPLGGQITQDDAGFRVRLVAQKRIHFYEYDGFFPRVNPKLERRALKPFVFASEGYYDTDLNGAYRDLLTEIRHACRRAEMDFNAILKASSEVYEEHLG
jgi:hypothetical protein